jgi:stress response protein YsnF
LIEAVKQLSPKDRLKVNDAIWNEDMEIPVEHQRIVLDRIAKANPERLLDWDEVSKTL